MQSLSLQSLGIVLLALPLLALSISLNRSLCEELTKQADLDNEVSCQDYEAVSQEVVKMLFWEDWESNASKSVAAMDTSKLGCTNQCLDEYRLTLFQHLLYDCAADEARVNGYNSKAMKAASRYKILAAARSVCDAKPGCGPEVISVASKLASYGGPEKSMKAACDSTRGNESESVGCCLYGMTTVMLPGEIFVSSRGAPANIEWHGYLRKVNASVVDSWMEKYITEFTELHNATCSPAQLIKTSGCTSWSSLPDEVGKVIWSLEKALKDPSNEEPQDVSSTITTSTEVSSTITTSTEVSSTIATSTEVSSTITTSTEVSSKNIDAAVPGTALGSCTALSIVGMLILILS